MLSYTTQIVNFFNHIRVWYCGIVKDKKQWHEDKKKAQREENTYNDEKK